MYFDISINLKLKEKKAIFFFEIFEREKNVKKVLKNEFFVKL